MNIFRCINGHFFDTDEYNVCPTCGAEVAEEDDEEEKVTNMENPINHTKGFIHRFVKKSKPNNGSNESDLENNIEHVKPLPLDTPPNDVVNPNNGGLVPLQDVISRASANEEGKTSGYFKLKHDEMNQSSQMQSEPVVGWLVCIKGNHIGESFELFSGKNSIGRSNGNRIVLADDNGVSREKHAVIIFDPKNTEYYLQPGDGNGLTYVNGNCVLVTQRISNKDVIELSNCELMLFSLCNEEFSWDSYIKE